MPSCWVLVLALLGGACALPAPLSYSQALTKAVDTYNQRPEVQNAFRLLSADPEPGPCPHDVTPKQNRPIPPSWPWRWPTTYLDAILAAVRLLNQRISGPCTLRLRTAEPRPGWLGTLQRQREVSFLVEDAPCPPGVDCRSCELGALQRCVGTVSVEQQPTAELRCSPLRVQPLRNWWTRIREWWEGIRNRLRQRGAFHVRGRLNISSTARP
ncbi:cathelicidin-B1-like [Numida meleagris]|uniref:cathelicidin-B1-like n=1 Tax=Numida meleagris TaxID=8996 RepID=UPI000B3DCB32|nr:cathelicidin-B1-like [Numida meleagris]